MKWEISVLEKGAQIKRVRKNWKRKVRLVYQEIRSEVEHKFAIAVDDYVEVRVNPEHRLAVFILIKKLERKGYRCTLERNKIDWRRGRCQDILKVHFN